MTTATVGARYQVVIPAKERKQLALKPHQKVLVEQRDDEIVIRPLGGRSFRGITKALRSKEDPADYVAKLRAESPRQERMMGIDGGFGFRLSEKERKASLSIAANGHVSETAEFALGGTGDWEECDYERRPKLLCPYSCSGALKTGWKPVSSYSAGGSFSFSAVSASRSSFGWGGAMCRVAFRPPPSSTVKCSLCRLPRKWPVVRMMA